MGFPPGGSAQARYDLLMKADMVDVADIAAKLDIAHAFADKASLVIAILRKERGEGEPYAEARTQPRYGHLVADTGGATDGTVRWSFPPETARQTRMAQWLLETGMAEFLDHFLSKNADYGDEHLTGRGPAGEFIGIERKVGKLGAILWEGREMNHEGADEILRDLIGSCLIVLHQRAVGYTGKTTQTE